MDNRNRLSVADVFDKQPAAKREAFERENDLRRRALGLLFVLGESREEAERVLNMALQLNLE